MKTTLTQDYINKLLIEGKQIKINYGCNQNNIDRIEYYC